MELSIDVRELDQMEKDIAGASKVWPKYKKKALGQIGSRMRDVSKSICTISPKKSQYEDTLQDGVTTRPATDFQPGTLTKSITSQVIDENKVKVFVAMNKGAGEYAYKMHEERGSSWHNLGVGSQAKRGTLGKPVGGKFIERAIKAVQQARNDVAFLNQAFLKMKKTLEK